ncbi:MAG: hypothetical protein AAGC84_15455, partial [Pseudomonas sp.]
MHASRSPAGTRQGTQRAEGKRDHAARFPVNVASAASSILLLLESGFEDISEMKDFQQPFCAILCRHPKGAFMAIGKRDRTRSKLLV